MKDSAGEAGRWLRQTEHDLEFGWLALREACYGHACFIAQQAAEKAFKAVHHHRGERVVLGPSVAELAERPFEAFGEAQARTALDGARRRVTLASDRLAAD